MKDFLNEEINFLHLVSPALHSVFIYCCGKLRPPLILGSAKTRKSLHGRSPQMNAVQEGNFQGPYCSPQEKSTLQPSAASRLRADPASIATILHNGHYSPRSWGCQLRLLASTAPTGPGALAGGLCV